MRRAGRQPRDRAAGDRGARGRRPDRGTRARIARPRRRAGRAAQHADEPVRAGPLARTGRERPRALGRRSRRDDRRGGGVRDRARRRRLRARTRAHARRPSDIDRPQPRTSAAGSRAAGRRLHGRLAVRGAGARRLPAAARGLRARGSRRQRARGRAAGTVAGCARPVRDNGRHRRRSPGRGPRPDRVSRRPLSLSCDADAPCSPRGGEGQ